MTRRWRFVRTRPDRKRTFRDVGGVRGRWLAYLEVPGEATYQGAGNSKRAARLAAVSNRLSVLSNRRGAV